MEALNDTDPARCPRCGSHDLVVQVINNYPQGCRVVLRCDQCAAQSQAWQPRAEAVAK